MVAKTRNMEWMRGDSTHIGIEVKGVVPEELTFSVKKYKQDRAYVVQKTVGDGIEVDNNVPGNTENVTRYVMTIDPADTEELMPMRYCYDLEAVVNGDVLTLLVGEISLVSDVTRHTAEVGT